MKMVKAQRQIEISECDRIRRLSTALAAEILTIVLKYRYYGEYQSLVFKQIEEIAAFGIEKAEKRRVKRLQKALGFEFFDSIDSEIPRALLKVLRKHLSKKEVEIFAELEEGRN